MFQVYIDGKHLTDVNDPQAAYMTIVNVTAFQAPRVAEVFMAAGGIRMKTMHQVFLYPGDYGKLDAALKWHGWRNLTGKAPLKDLSDYSPT